MKRLIVLLAALSLLLSGCGGWMDGSYYNEVPHTPEKSDEKQGVQAVENYSQLCGALEEAVARGEEHLMVSVSGYPENRLDADLKNSVRHILEDDPKGAYAVESVNFEQGTSGGLEVVAMSIQYNHNRSALRSIRHVENDTEAMDLISTVLTEFGDSIVVQIRRYGETDFTQFIGDFADRNPELVMELPEVTVNVYPDRGSTRLVELNFTYQNSRETLLAMKKYVQPVFSAAMYVPGDVADSVKYTQLYSFLMERYDYTVETSITPSYSLLRYGVGDSRAFAQVYDAMCRRSGLECQVVSGTKNGEPYYWNMILEDGVYYHVDLLESRQAGEMTRLSDQDMQGYVWDYAMYPACGVTEEPPVETVG